MERETYLSERKTLIEIEIGSARSFDKAMLTLSAGALAISLTFIHDIAPSPKLKFLLILVWFCLIASLFTTLLSFLFSVEACREQRKILNASYESDQIKEQENIWDKRTGALNWCSILFFIIGVTFLFIFTLLNLP